MHTTSAPLASDSAAMVDAVPRTLPRPRPRQPTLAVQFLVTNLLVLLASMAVIGSWVGAQLEAGVYTHTGETAAFYVDGVLSPRLQVLASNGTLDESDMAQ